MVTGSRRAWGRPRARVADVAVALGGAAANQPAKRAVAVAAAFHVPERAVRPRFNVHVGGHAVDCGNRSDQGAVGVGREVIELASVVDGHEDVIVPCGIWLPV